MKRQVFFIAAVSLFFPLTLKADRVQVINENKKALGVKIQAEGDTLNENLAEFNLIIPAEYYYEFFVTKSDLKGKNLYSIKGDTSPFTAGGSCKSLSVDKKYKVVFKNDTVGTSCVATEIKT